MFIVLFQCTLVKAHWVASVLSRLVLIDLDPLTDYASYVSKHFDFKMGQHRFFTLMSYGVLSK